MLNNGYRYVKTLIDIDQLLKDTKKQVSADFSERFQGKKKRKWRNRDPGGNDTWFTDPRRSLRTSDR